MSHDGKIVKKNLLLNSAATAGQNIFLAARNLILVPFFIGTWGAGTFGDWVTLSVFPATMSLFNMGMGTAAGHSFVLEYTKGNLEAAAKAARIGHLLVTAAVTAGLLLMAGGLWFAQSSSLLTHFSVPAGEVSLTILFLVSSCLLRFYGSLNEAWFRAARKSHLYTNINSLCGVLLALGQIILLLFSKGMAWLAAADLLVTAASMVWFHYRGRRMVGNLPAPPGGNSRKDFLRYFGKGLAYMAGSARQALQIQGQILLTKAALGSEAVALLATLRTIANSLSQIYLAINNSIFPELQQAIARDQLPLARKIYRSGICAALLVSSAGALFLMLFGDMVYRIWTHGKLNPPWSAWLLLIASAVASSLWWTAGCTFRAVNRPEGPAAAGMVSALIGLGATALLLDAWGVSGALAGVLLTELLMAAYILPASCRIIRQPLALLPKDLASTGTDVVNLIKRRFPVRKQS